MLCVPPFAERVQVELEVGAGDDRCDPRAMLLAAAPALEEVCAGRGDVRVNPGPETLGIAAAPAEGKVTHYTTGGYRCGTKRATSRRQESRSYRSQSRVAGATCVHILDCLEFKTKILRVSIHYTNLVK